MPSDLLVLTASDVSSILSSLPPQPLLSHSASLFHSLTNSPLPPSLTPHRTPLPLPNHTSLIMPARIPSHGSALKIVSVPSQSGDKRGLPATTLVLDEHTGALKAVVNARQLTAARTAAGTVLATTLLHPPSGSEVKRVLVFGAGAQARAHAELLATVYAPSLRALIFVVRSSRSPSTESLLISLRARFPSLSIYAVDTPMYDSVQVSHADVIVTATPSTTPLFDSAHVKSGAHIIMVGSWRPDMREVDDALIRRAAGSIVVDSRAACAKEAGELISAEVDMDTCVEIGELVEGISEGGEVRRDELVCERVVKGGEVSIVKSVGVGAQDVAIAALVVRAAEERGVGTRVPAYDLGATED